MMRKLIRIVEKTVEKKEHDEFIENGISGIFLKIFLPILIRVDPNYIGLI